MPQTRSAFLSALSLLRAINLSLFLYLALSPFYQHLYFCFSIFFLPLSSYSISSLLPPVFLSILTRPPFTLHAFSLTLSPLSLSLPSVLLHLCWLSLFIKERETLSLIFSMIFNYYYVFIYLLLFIIFLNGFYYMFKVIYLSILYYLMTSFYFGEYFSA